MITSACGGAAATGVAQRLAADPTTMAVVTAKPLGGPQANVAIANAHSSQAPNDMTFYQGTEGTANPFNANSAGRTGTSLALFGLGSAALAFIL